MLEETWVKRFLYFANASVTLINSCLTSSKPHLLADELRMFLNLSLDFEPPCEPPEHVNLLRPLIKITPIEILRVLCLVRTVNDKILGFLDKIGKVYEDM